MKKSKQFNNSNITSNITALMLMLSVTFTKDSVNVLSLRWLANPDYYKNIKLLSSVEDTLCTLAKETHT